MQLNTKKYDAFCSHIFDNACLRLRPIAILKRFETTENCIHQKHFLNGW